VKHRNSRVREIAFHTLFCMVSMVSILLTMQKEIHVRIQAPITMREFQFFESIIEKIFFSITDSVILHIIFLHFCKIETIETIPNSV
jgi:hypothetical protein